MKQLLTGHDKIEKICETIRQESLEPAKIEALKIIEDAKNQAATLLSEAQKQIDQMQKDARAQIEQERTVFQSSLDQGVQLSLEYLKQEIFTLFDNELENRVLDSTSSPSKIAKIIEVICEAVDKEGLDTDIEALIPKNVSTKDILTELSDAIKSKITEESIKIGKFKGGAQLRLLDKKITIDITDDTIKELLSNYIRKDFRKVIFSK